MGVAFLLWTLLVLLRGRQATGEDGVFSCAAGNPCLNLGPLTAPGANGRLRVQRFCFDDEGYEEVELSTQDPSLKGLALLERTGSELNFSFTGRMDLVQPAYSYELCWCELSIAQECNDSSGFEQSVGEIRIDGVFTETFATCHLGQACSVRDENWGLGVGLQEGDRLTVLQSCGGKWLWGLPGNGIMVTAEGMSFDFVVGPGERAVMQVHPGIYKLCFCRPSEWGDCNESSQFVADAGFLSVAGPYVEQSFFCHINETCNLDDFNGVSLTGADRIQVMRSCGNSSSPLPLVTAAASDDGHEFALGFFPLQSTRPGTYELCWCAGAYPCNSSQHFATRSSWLELHCPPRFFDNGAACQLCEVDSYCPGDRGPEKLRCPANSGTNSLEGAASPSECLCLPGFSAVSGIGTAALLCAPCTRGTFAFLYGETACHPGTFACVVGRPCRGLAPDPGLRIQSGDNLRVQRECGVDGSSSTVYLANSSQSGDANLSIVGGRVMFGFGDDAVEVAPAEAYAICWCQRTLMGDCLHTVDFSVETGLLEVQGPHRSQWECTLGKECVIAPVTGVGLLAGDSLIVAYSCGTPDAKPYGLPGSGVAVNDGSGAFHFGAEPGNENILMTEPGIFRLCFCRPIDLACNATRDFKYDMGQLTANGPRSAQSHFSCTLGRPCSVPDIHGVGLLAGDSLSLVKTCTQSACGLGICGLRLHAGTPPSEYHLPSLDTHIPPGDWVLCWCSAKGPCNNEADYNVDAATVSLVCPDHQVIKSGACTACCESCFMVRYSVANNGDDPSLRTCSLNEMHLVAFILLALIGPMLVLALSVSFGPPVSLEDIERDDQVVQPVKQALGSTTKSLQSQSVKATVATTARGHRVLRYASVPVRFRGTCVPWLDSGKQKYLARFIDGRRLRVLNADGQEVELPCDTSRGRMRVPLPHAALCCGFLWVPFAAWVVVFLAAAALCIYMGSLDAVEVSAIAAFSVLVAAIFHALQQSWAQFTNILAACAAYRLRLVRKQMLPQAGPRGASRALRAEVLVDFYSFFQAFIRDRNMYYICPNIVKPLTRPEQISFAELVGPHVVDWFVSHYWGMPFKHFVASIQKHAESVAGGVDWRRISYWVCTFSNNQWKVSDEVGDGDWKESSFYKALRSGFCQGTAMVLDEQAQPLTRSWCLFEVLQTSLLERDDPAFAGLLLCTSSGVLNKGTASMDVAASLARKLASLRLQDATASCQEDKEMIDGLVESMAGGFAMVNDFVREGIRAALLTMKRHFDTELEGISSMLAESHERISRPGTSAPQNETIVKVHDEVPLEAIGHFRPKSPTPDTGTIAEEEDEVLLPGAAP